MTLTYIKERYENGFMSYDDAIDALLDLGYYTLEAEETVSEWVSYEDGFGN